MTSNFTSCGYIPERNPKQGPGQMYLYSYIQNSIIRNAKGEASHTSIGSLDKCSILAYTIGIFTRPLKERDF